MTKAEAIKALRSILAKLYEDVDEAKRIVQDTGLNTSFIKWGGSAVTNWFNILSEADKRNKVDDLLSAVSKDYGNDDPNFQQAYQVYLTVTGQAASPVSQPAGTPVTTRPVKILFLAANPDGTEPLKLAEEARAIEEALRKARFYEQFDLRPKLAVRYTDLQELLLEYKPDIVHFSGHGSTAGELQFQNENGDLHIVSPQALTDLFRLVKKNIRCVVLNACYTVLQGRAIAEEIDAVVGMNRALGDKAAIQFAAGFYSALGAGESVKSAFDLGCNRIGLAGLEEEDKPQLLTPNSDPNKLVFAGNS